MTVKFFQKDEKFEYYTYFTILQYLRYQKLEMQYDYTTGILLNTKCNHQ